MLNKSKYKNYVLCCDCGYAILARSAFVKSYKITGLCLCKKCALKLAQEISKRYKNEDVSNNDNNNSPYDHIWDMYYNEFEDVKSEGDLK